MYCKYCNKEVANQGHRCKELIDFNKKKYLELLENDGQILIDLYVNKGYSIIELLKNFETHRKNIEKALKYLGVFENIHQRSNNKNAVKRKTEKIEKTTYENYGVINIGMLDGFGWDKLNSYEKDIPKFIDEFNEYKNNANKIARKNRRKLPITNYCEYTGIQFIDCEKKDVNPNDYRKRSLDHRISLLECFLSKLSIEEASHESNLCYVLRYCNSIKNGTSSESFKPLANLIREKFIDEGYKYKEID